jgi:phage head maturation protease
MYIEAEVVLNDSIQMHKSIIHGLRHGLIKGFSIGFGDVQYHYDREKDANIITSLELYEISLVDIPDNPLTVVKALQFYKEKIEKAAVPFRSYDLMDEGAEWSGSTAEGTVRKRASSDGS